MSGVALVTGGSRGIGAATAHRLVAAGYQVVTASRTGAAPTGITVAGSIAMDVADPESIEAGLDEVVKEHGSISVLIANAGITRDALVMRMSDEDIDQVLMTNLAGTIRLCRGVARGMLRAKAGRIVLVSSVVALMGSAGQVNYSASKAGLIGAARSLARELGSRGITVNVVAPGFVNTDMTSELDEQRRSEILSAIPAGRYAEPDEVAAAIEFLVGPAAAYITGAIMPVDGGLGMGH